MYFLLEKVDFHCYFSLPEGKEFMIFLNMNNFKPIYIINTHHSPMPHAQPNQ